VRSNHLSKPNKDAGSSPRKSTEQTSKGALTLLDAFLLSQQVEEGKAPVTLRNYRYALLPFLAWCGEREPRTLTSEDLQAYLAHVHRLLPNPFSRFGRIKPLKVFYAWLERKGLTSANPTASVRLPRLPETVGPTPTLQQVKALIQACPTTTMEGLRNRALILVALDTGLRANELRTLRLPDLNFSERLARVTGKARPGQAPSARSVPLSPGSLRTLRAYLAARRDVPGDVLFCDRSGNQLTRRGFGEVLERLRERARVSVTWHGLRRTFTTEALRAGCPEDILRRILGHKDLRMLQRYAAVQTADLVRFHDLTAPTRFLAE